MCLPRATEAPDHSYSPHVETEGRNPHTTGSSSENTMVLVASSGLRTVLREAKQLVGVDRGTALRNLLPDLSREISFIRRVKAFLVARSIVSALC